MLGSSLGRRDMLVLRGLDSDGRASAASIAKGAGISKQSVLRRLRSLSQDGLLKRVYALVDSAKLGKTEYRVFFKLEGVSSKQLGQLVDFCTLHPAVQGFALCGGAFQLVLSVSCSSTGELDGLLGEVERKFSKAIGQKQVGVVVAKSVAGNSFAYSPVGKREEREEFEQAAPLRGRVSYWDLVPTAQDFEQLQEIMRELGLKGAGLAAQELVDESFALKAYQKIGSFEREKEWL